MEDTNYELILQMLEEEKQERLKLEKDFKELASFNRALLNRNNEPNKNDTNLNSRMEEYIYGNENNK